MDLYTFLPSRIGAFIYFGLSILILVLLKSEFNAFLKKNSIQKSNIDTLDFVSQRIVFTQNMTVYFVLIFVQSTILVFIAIVGITNDIPSILTAIEMSYLYLLAERNFMVKNLKGIPAILILILNMFYYVLGNSYMAPFVLYGIIIVQLLFLMALNHAKLEKPMFFKSISLFSISFVFIFLFTCYSLLESLIDPLLSSLTLDLIYSIFYIIQEALVLILNAMAVLWIFRKQSIPPNLTIHDKSNLSSDDISMINNDPSTENQSN
jgi:hypothetical protein